MIIHNYTGLIINNVVGCVCYRKIRMLTDSMGSINEITFIRWKLSPFEAKLAKTLKKEGIKVSSVTIYETKNEFKKNFDGEIFWLKQSEKNISKLKKFNHFLPFIRKIMKKKYSILIGVTSTGNWFTAFMFWILRTKADKRFYFPYDISFFRYDDSKKIPFYERFSEKYNFNKCAGIIHKGPEDELQHLPKKFNALLKPSIQFLPYCDNNLMEKIDDEYFKRKLSKKDKHTHLVYVGGVYHNDPAHFPTITIFQEIVKQELHLHVFPVNYEKLHKDKEYRQLQKNKYFHIHKPIYGNEFQKELSKYDWGIFIFYFNFKKIKKEWAGTSFGNKISSYLEAGLPSIINTEQSFAAEIVKKKGFGIVIKNTEDISKALSEIPYDELVKSLDKARKEFTISQNIDRLIKFIETISNNKERCKK